MTARAYGPHRPEDLPNGVLVLAVGRYWRSDGKHQGERVVPFPAALAKQREQINRLAHRAGVK